MRKIIFISLFLILSSFVYAEPILNINKTEITSFGGVVDKNGRDAQIHTGEIINYSITFNYNQEKTTIFLIEVNVTNPDGEVIDSILFPQIVSTGTVFSIKSSQKDGSWRLIYAGGPGIYKLEISAKEIAANRTPITFIENNSFGWRYGQKMPFFFEIETISSKKQKEFLEAQYGENKRQQEENNKNNAKTLELNESMKFYSFVSMLVAIVTLFIGLVQLLSISEGKKTLYRTTFNFLKFGMMTFLILAIGAFILGIIGFFFFQTK